MTRLRRGLSRALALACLCAALPSPAGAAQPNDPRFGEQWGLADINAPAAWDISTGAGVTVAVVDTGVMAAHVDLAGQIAPGGWGIGNSTADESGHGTQVAGVIAATKDNREGIAGVAPGASILPIRAFRDTESVTADDIVAALDRAGKSGARVVNASLSSDPMSPSRPETSQVAQQMKTVLRAHPNTLFVTAAGNGPEGGTNNDEMPVFPCSAEVSNLLCVGAYTLQQRRWSGGNYGASSVDLFAPGAGILSTTISGGYAASTGTSLAAPFVSGEAALLFAKVPGLTPEEAINVILSTSRRVPAFAGLSVSEGKPDARAALDSAVADQDRDGVYDILDACPTQPHATADGCVRTAEPPAATPTPVATVTPRPLEPVPQVRSLTAKVTRCKRGRTCRRSATIRLTPDRTATVSLRVERKACTRGRCRWTRVLAKTLSASTGGTSVVVRGRRATSLPKAGYRAVAVPSSPAGTGKAVTRTFRVP